MCVVAKPCHISGNTMTARLLWIRSSQCFRCYTLWVLFVLEKTFCLIFITFGLWFIWSLAVSNNEKPVAYSYLFASFSVCVPLSRFSACIIIVFDKPNSSAQTAIPLKFEMWNICETKEHKTNHKSLLLLNASLSNSCNSLWAAVFFSFTFSLSLFLTISE